jgi:glycosyltransferase involved in cell wall biosynthesis
MRILHVVTAFPRNEADVITPWLVETLAHLRSTGAAIEVFAPSYKGLPSGSFRGVPVWRFRYFFRRWENLTHDETVPDRLRRYPGYYLVLPFYLLLGSLSILRLSRRRQYDIIHVHWPFPHAVFGFVAKLAGGGKVVSTFYGVELRWVKHKMPALRPVMSWAISASDAVIAISSDTAKEIEQFRTGRVEIVPYGVAVSGEPPAPSDSHPRKTILFVGRLVERKGVHVLLEALRELTTDPAVHLVVVGEGPERARLEALAQQLDVGSRVGFRGRISAAELDVAYSACDVFALPAVTDVKGDTEGLGVVLLEAMSYSKPVVASNSGGITDIVMDGQTGLLVPPGNPQELARALRRVLDDPSYGRSLGESGRARVLETFDWESITRRLLSIYHDLLA